MKSLRNNSGCFCFGADRPCVQAYIFGCMFLYGWLLAELFRWLEHGRINILVSNEDEPVFLFFAILTVVVLVAQIFSLLFSMPVEKTSHRLAQLLFLVFLFFFVGMAVSMLCIMYDTFIGIHHTVIITGGTP